MLSVRLVVPPSVTRVLYDETKDICGYAYDILHVMLGYSDFVMSYLFNNSLTVPCARGPDCYPGTCDSGGSGCVCPPGFTGNNCESSQFMTFYVSVLVLFAFIILRSSKFAYAVLKT